MSYAVKVTKQAYGQMREIMLYITNELFAPEAAQNLRLYSKQGDQHRIL